MSFSIHTLIIRSDMTEDQLASSTCVDVFSDVIEYSRVMLLSRQVGDSSLWWCSSIKQVDA